MAIIGVSGKIGSGKDTVGHIIQYLTEPELQNASGCQDFLENGHVMINYPYTWQIKKFADKLKECISIITGISREDLEKSEVKNSELGREWDYAKITSKSTFSQKERFSHHSDALSYANSMRKQIAGSDYTATTFNMTVRQLLQEFGTEVGRSIHPNFWINALFSEYKGYYSPIHDAVDNAEDAKTFNKVKYPNWIITDMRFPNELKTVKDRGGITIRCNRGIYPNDSINIQAHPSETALDNATFDYTIDNSGSIEDLIEKVKEILIKEKII